MEISESKHPHTGTIYFGYEILFLVLGEE